MTRMPKNELPLVISYLTAAAGLVWILHIMGNYYVDRMAHAFCWLAAIHPAPRANDSQRVSNSICRAPDTTSVLGCFHHRPSSASIGD